MVGIDFGEHQGGAPAGGGVRGGIGSRPAVALFLVGDERRLPVQDVGAHAHVAPLGGSRGAADGVGGAAEQLVDGRGVILRNLESERTGEDLRQGFRIVFRLGGGLRPARRVAQGLAPAVLQPVIEKCDAGRIGRRGQIERAVGQLCPLQVRTVILGRCAGLQEQDEQQRGEDGGDLVHFFGFVCCKNTKTICKFALSTLYHVLWTTTITSNP